MDAMEARTAKEARTRAPLWSRNSNSDEELESFSYSVAHDLRAPLRSIDGFGLILLEDYSDKLDAKPAIFHYVRESAQHMARLIDDLWRCPRPTRRVQLARGRCERDCPHRLEPAAQIGADARSNGLSPTGSGSRPTGGLVTIVSRTARMR